jgi:hypothetical protein
MTDIGDSPFPLKSLHAQWCKFLKIHRARDNFLDSYGKYATSARNTTTVAMQIG